MDNDIDWETWLHEELEPEYWETEDYSEYEMVGECDNIPDLC